MVTALFIVLLSENVRLDSFSDFTTWEMIHNTSIWFKKHVDDFGERESRAELVCITGCQPYQYFSFYVHALFTVYFRRYDFTVKMGWLIKCSKWISKTTGFRLT